MKKFIAFLTAAVLVISVFAISAAAATTIYFYDTNGEIASNPQFKSGDLNWGGFLPMPLTDLGDGWYSYDAEFDGGPETAFNMFIFFNGLEDADPACVQYVWHTARGLPNGNYFVADNTVAPNPPENNYQGVQYDAVSFATKEEADAYILNLSGAAAADEAPAAGDTEAAAGTSKGSADTGIEGVAFVAGTAIIAAGAVIISKRRK